MDEELVHALKHGSPGEVVAALAEVHLRYGQRLLGIARRVVGDQAEDVYHSVLVDLPRRVQSFRLQQGGSFSGWLARCVHRAAIDAWRQERRLHQREMPQAEFSEELMGGAPTGADSQVGCDPAEVVAEQLEQDALKVEVREVLSQLSDDDRDILCAVDMAGLSPGEYAEVKGISPAAARQRLSRARRRFRELGDRYSHIRARLAGDQL
ncbi:MAG: sigma-70 family RNA polymerase sigma factor [Bacillota bacterium]